MSGKRYPEEFKIEAVKQVVDRGHSVSSVATRLDITTHSLYAWIKKYGPDSSTNNAQSDAQAEIRRLQKELKRVTDERDILKKAAAYFAKLPTEVRLYPRQQPLLACSPALSGSGCPSEWILFLASAAAFTARAGEPDADRADNSSGLSLAASMVIARSISICVIPGSSAE